MILISAANNWMTYSKTPYYKVKKAILICKSQFSLVCFENYIKSIISKITSIAPGPKEVI